MEEEIKRILRMKGDDVDSSFMRKGGYSVRFYSIGRALSSLSAEQCPIADYSSRHPKYWELDSDQASTYLYWRECVRRGEFFNVPFSYIHLYALELISLIGVSNPKEGSDRLIELWNNAPDPRFYSWIHDYFIVYDVLSSYRKLSSSFPKNAFNESLICSKLIDGDYSFDQTFLSDNSSYHFADSQFSSTKLGWMVAKCIPVLLESADRYLSDL